MDDEDSWVEDEEDLITLYNGYYGSELGCRSSEELKSLGMSNEDLTDEQIDESSDKIMKLLIEYFV